MHMQMLLEVSIVPLHLMVNTDDKSTEYFSIHQSLKDYPRWEKLTNIKNSIAFLYYVVKCDRLKIK